MVALGNAMGVALLSFGRNWRCSVRRNLKQEKTEACVLDPPGKTFELWDDESF